MQTVANRRLMLWGCLLGAGMAALADAALTGRLTTRTLVLGGLGFALSWPMCLLVFWVRKRVTGWRRAAGTADQAVAVGRRLLRLLAPHRWKVTAGAAVTIAIAAAGLAKPWPTKILVDDVFGDPARSGSANGWLLAAVALTLLLFVVAGALSVLQIRILYGLTQRLIRDLRESLFGHLSRLSLRYHDKAGVGDLAYRVSADTYSLDTLLVSGLVPIVSAGLTLVGTVVVMAGLDPVLAVLSLVSAPLAAVIAQRFGRRIRTMSKSVHERESDVYTHAEQALSGIRTVQSFARESLEQRRFTRHAHASQEAMVRLVTKQSVFALAVDVVLGAGLALVTWVAATRALDGHITLGEMLVFLAYAAALYTPISELANVVGDLQAAAAGAQRVFEVLNEPLPEDRALPTPAPRPRATGHLRLEKVRFSYLPEQPVLQGVDLTIPAGSTVAIVGPTGAGKSTILSLLLRLYDADSGRVLIDGTNMRDVRTKWLRQQIAFVPQEPVLFPGTVAENIRYGRLDATDAEVDEAARLANLYDELLVDALGLDTLVGDRGGTLSGGQRQRVALARAFVKDAPIVMLDEPTSALDARTEALVMEALWRLSAGRTCVIIAHRLATVHHADRVVVVDAGAIAQEGTHDTLACQDGIYRELHEARFGAEPQRS